MRVIDGKAVAVAVQEEVAVGVAALPFVPSLAVILVGDDPASAVYVRNKVKACQSVGIRSVEQRLPATATTFEIAHVIDAFNADRDIHGILLQLPLPKGLDSAPLIQRIDPAKDVDGLTYVNIGRVVAGDEEGLVPCTPQGAMHLIKMVREKDLSGLYAVVLGRSLLFGKPMGQLLLHADCTVTQVHSRTKNLPDVVRGADIVVVAVGKPEIVKGNWIKKGATVIDVGINRRDDGSLCGDVDFLDVCTVAGAITPVPGGVGPMTVAFLMQNTLKAAQRLR